MERLLDLLNARTFAAAAMLAAAIFLGVKFQDHPRNFYKRWRYTSLTEKTPLATSIEKDLEAKASRKLRVLHREVSAEISRAEAEGFRLGSLQAAADAILQLDTPALRSQAVDRLQKLRLAIPKKTPKLRVANDEDDADETPPPAVSNAGRPRARKK